MAQFTVDIPDELLPGLVAKLSTISNAPTLDEYFAASAVELMRQCCKVYKVGPYYVGAILPQFNADGKPYTSPESGESKVTE